MSGTRNQEQRVKNKMNLGIKLHSHIRSFSSNFTALPTAYKHIPV